MTGIKDLIHLTSLGTRNMILLSIGSTYQVQMNLGLVGEMTSIHLMNPDGKLAKTGLSKRTMSLFGEIKSIQLMENWSLSLSHVMAMYRDKEHNLILILQLISRMIQHQAKMVHAPCVMEC